MYWLHVATRSRHLESKIVARAASLCPLGEPEAILVTLRFEAKSPGVKVRLNLAGSQELRTQLENGARADVFASADQKSDVRAAQALAVILVVIALTIIIFLRPRRARSRR